DLLVLTNDTVTSSLKERIGRMKYEIELRHDVVISVLVENTLYWRSALACAMPLHKNIDRDGITL
ncbi:MAG: hypothetical protein NTX06_07970, partial [Proteobacteria bacterium]|nr:hypothetical protein [Pseudomonadota bacterium]